MITHKFLNVPVNTIFPDGFYTENTILKNDSYKPEVIFIGTFNHGWDWNPADFFYGRGMYMWTALGNLFLHNNNNLIQRRSVNNDNPTFNQLFEICQKGKISFADIVKGTTPNIPAIPNPVVNDVLVNQNYTWRGYKDKPLDEMGANGWLDDNVEAIVKYINETISIKHVYFTFKSGDWLVNKKNLIIAGIRNNVTAYSIFTPTANGFGPNLKAPFNERAWSLTHCWVWNGQNNAVPINKPDYDHLDHDWLRRHGVNPNNF